MGVEGKASGRRSPGGNRFRPRRLSVSSSVLSFIQIPENAERSRPCASACSGDSTSATASIRGLCQLNGLLVVPIAVLLSVLMASAVVVVDGSVFLVHFKEGAARLPAAQWMQQDAYLVPRLQHGALPAVAREDVRTSTFQAPFHFLAGLVRHQHLDPGMWIGPLEFPDPAFQPDFLAAVEHAEAVMRRTRRWQQRQGHQ